DTALQANLGGAAVPRLFAAPHDLVQIEVVGPAAQVFAELALRKGAELAAEIADVGVIDVAGDDVADRVAVDLAAQIVGGGADPVEFPTARLEQPHDVSLGQRFARRRAINNFCNALTRPRALRSGTLSRNAGEGLYCAAIKPLSRTTGEGG